MESIFQMTPGIYQGDLIMIAQNLTYQEEPTCGKMLKRF
jgi:hypothetical protein